MKMLRILVFAEIRQDAGRAFFAKNICRNYPHYLEQLDKQFVIDYQEGVDMGLRNHYDVRLPKWARVMICKNVLGLDNLLDLRLA